MSHPVDRDGPRVMWSVSQIATRDGISKQAVSKIVKSLIENTDIPVERDGRGRVSSLSLAHYDHHRSQFTNPAKTNVSRSEPIGSTSSPFRLDSFDEARRQGEWLKVEREKLRRQEELKQLVRADLLSEALAVCGKEIQSIISRLQNRADEVALAVSKEGVHGARLLLRQIAFDLNTAIADKLDEIIIDAPARDPQIVDEDITP